MIVNLLLLAVILAVLFVIAIMIWQLRKPPGQWTCSATAVRKSHYGIWLISERYIAALERQDWMFRNGEIQLGRDLDGALAAAKKAMLKSQRAWNEHQKSHSKAKRA
jgi:hypothetical protein